MTYFKAEDHGLEYVGGVDWLRGEGCYEWEDTTVLYHRETDTFYWETSGGCSCDGPLDDVESLDDLDKGTFHQLAEHIVVTLDDVRKRTWRGEDSEGMLDLEATRVIEAAIRIREGN